MLDKRLLARMKATFLPSVGEGATRAVHTIDTDSEPANGGSADEEEDDGSASPTSYLHRDGRTKLS